MNCWLKRQVLPFILITLIAAASNSYAADNWPIKGWRTSTPEEQGMDSKAIVQVLKIIRARKLNIHSMLIVRNGYLVTEAYFAPYQRDVKQNIDACTNSVTSALVGIAQNQGLLSDLDQPVLEFFPERTVAKMDNRKQEIILRDLLTMTSGLDWDQQGPFLKKKNDLYLAMSSPDMVQYVLDKPMAGQPGVRFNYNAGTVHLLSAIIQKATGASEADYAREHLFKPMGIQEFYWATVSGGATYASGGLAMTPSDMAKFGLLYLNKGLWDGRQVVPTKWVQESTKSFIGDHGYLWWRNPFFDGYEANAFGGQFIFVVPKYNIVAVFTGGLNDQDFALPQRWMVEKILPAVKSSRSLAPNPAMNGLLSKMIRDLQNQSVSPLRRLPNMAGRVSGRTYVCEPNFSGLSSLNLKFQQNRCILTAMRHNETLEIPVGLDNCFQSAKIGPHYYFAKGRWRTQETFGLELQLPSEYAEIFKLYLYFKKDRVSVNVVDSSAGVEFSFNGKAKE